MAEINFKKEYRDLEMRIHNALRTKIENSKIKSKYVEEKCIKTNDDFMELVILHDRLTFICHDGLQFSISEMNLEDLIDLI